MFGFYIECDGSDVCVCVGVQCGYAANRIFQQFAIKTQSQFRISLLCSHILLFPPNFRTYSLQLQFQLKVVNGLGIFHISAV